MQVVSISPEVLKSDKALNLYPGEYLIPNETVREIQESWRNTGLDIIADVKPFERANWQFPQEITSLLAWNTGATGDQLYMTAFVRAVKKLMPRCQIDVVSNSYTGLWDKNKDIRAVRYPYVPLSVLKYYDAYFIIDEDIVNLSGKDQPNCYEYIFRMAGMEYNGELPNVTLFATDELRAFTKATGVSVGQESKMPTAYVVLGLHASRQSRNISKEQWLGIAKEICSYASEVEGFTIYSLANDEFGHEIQKTLNEVSCHVPLFASLNLREIAALLRSAMCVVSVDSMAVHLSAAVNAPCVAIMTTVPPSARTKTYPLCVSLWAEGACKFSGCSWKGRDFAERKADISITSLCYTPSKRFCNVGAAIKPGHVISAMEQAMVAKSEFDEWKIPALPVLY